MVQSQIPPLYGNVLVLQGNIVNTTTQINNLYGNVSVVQSQIPPLYSNVLVQQTKTTAISYIPTTTTISSNVVVSGFLDVSNCLVQNNAGIGYSLGIGGNLAVGTDIVNSGNIVCGKTMFSNTINTQNLVLNSQVIQSDTQAQITYIYNNLFQPLWRPLFNTINPLNLVLYYPFTSTLYFNSNTVIGLNVGNLATGTIVYDASLSGLTNIVNNKLSSLHTAQPPAGQHGLVINRSVSIPSGATDGCSFSFWFICTSLPSSTYWFLTTLQSSGGTRFFITIDPTNKININASTITSQNTVIVGNIYHVAVVMNTDPPTSNAITKMYINGVLQITTGGITYPSFTNTSGFNSIARDPLGNGLIGTIDDYRLYTRPITALEVSTLYSLSPYI